VGELRLHYWPDAILLEKCEPWDFGQRDYDDGFYNTVNRQHLVGQMWDIMLAKRGLGLAAPQVGIKRRMFVLRRDGPGPLACFNPSVDEQWGALRADPEGCLSFPDLFYPIGRRDHVRGRYQNAEGEERVVTLEGQLARCFLHELDHLNGITIEQRVTSVGRAMAAKKARA
jgi:peptide deformylase